MKKLTSLSGLCLAALFSLSSTAFAEEDILAKGIDREIAPLQAERRALTTDARTNGCMSIDAAHAQTNLAVECRATLARIARIDLELADLYNGGWNTIRACTECERLAQSLRRQYDERAGQMHAEALQFELQRQYNRMPPGFRSTFFPLDNASVTPPPSSATPARPF